MTGDETSIIFTASIVGAVGACYRALKGSASLRRRWPWLSDNLAQVAIEGWFCFILGGLLIVFGGHYFGLWG